MEYVIDPHVHTLASGHAYNSLLEMTEAGREAGLRAVGIAEHGPAMPGTCDPVYFKNFAAVSREIRGMRIYMGIEMNVLDYEGSVDIEDRYIQHIDFGIAGIHPFCGRPPYEGYRPGTVKENTRAYRKVMEHPKVNIIAHPDDVRVPVDYDQLARGAAQNHVLLELNVSSLCEYKARVQSGTRENIKEMLSWCEKYGVSVIVGSDAHFVSDVGRFEKAEVLLQEVHFPEELVVNRSLEEYEKFILRKS